MATDSSCPRCTHGKGFNCPVCWPKPAADARTEALVVSAARAMCEHDAKACSIDSGDCWNAYGQEYTDGARVAVAVLENATSEDLAELRARLRTLQLCASGLLRYLHRSYDPDQWDDSTKELMQELERALGDSNDNT